jgi:ribulose-5-phosphate 4-epimerase/fuculose-1-phosphate aldolase
MSPNVEQASKKQKTDGAGPDLSNNNTFKGSELAPCKLDAAKYPLTTASPALWQARVDLAGVYRMSHNARFNEGVCNHLTVMAPGHDDKFLVIAYGLMWSEVTASNLLLVDKTGKVLEGEGKPEHTAFFIHSELHMADPVNNVCILHTHQPYASAICCLEGGKLEMVHQNCLRFYEDIAYDREFNGLVMDDNEGKRLAKVMDGKRILFHSNHGVITVGKSVAQAWDDLYYLERACEVYVLACSTGKQLMYISDEVALGFKKDLDEGGDQWAKMFFEAAKRDLVKQGRDADFAS